MRMVLLIACVSLGCGKKPAESSQSSPAGANSSVVDQANAQIKKVEAALASGNLKDAASECGLMPDADKLARADAQVAAKARTVCERDRLLAMARQDLASVEQARKDKPDAKPGIECDEHHVDHDVKDLRETVASLKQRGIDAPVDDATLTDLEKRYAALCPGP